ncbi:MAG: GNAT family N-acetyltransferase [Saprospirales bacterium]|nr:GNAT family N-acetyltransferase [Saprospirales bacterium]
MNLQFSPFPERSSERLQLRQMNEADIQEIFFFHSDERIQEFIYRPKAETLEDIRHFIKKVIAGISNNEWIYWVLGLKPSGQVIGTICLWNIVPEENKAEIGYELHPDFQGKGLMQEAVVEVLNYGFEHMQLHEIEAYLQGGNSRSLKLLERNNFHFVRNLSEDEKMENEKGLEVVVYTLKNSLVLFEH